MKKALIGMSGGVDSSVAVYLLKQQGFECEGVTLALHSTDGVQDTVEKASALIAEKGYKFPVFYDTTQQAVTMYQITALPTTYFIDAEGNLVTGARGLLSAEDLQRGIDLIT